MIVVGRLGFAVIALVLVSLAGCGRGPSEADDDPGAPVFWRLASAAEPQATVLEIEVMSGSCVLGTPGPDDIMPVKSIDVVETSGTVEISVALGPMPDAALDRCGGDESGMFTAMPARGIVTKHIVQLASPLGDRTLIDPACDEEKFTAGSCEHPAR